MATRDTKWWQSAINNGMRFQVVQAQSNSWKVYKDYYRHIFKKGTLPVNLVFSLLRTIIPQTYFRNPQVTLTAVRPGLEYELHARLIEDVDNWLIREVGVKYQMKRLIADGFLCGIGSGFHGYDSQFGFSAKEAKALGGSATLSQFDKKGDRIEYYENVGPGMPWFLRARPEDVIYPWGCECKENAEWVAMRVFRPLEDLKADPKYINKDKLTGKFVPIRSRPEGGAADIEFPMDEQKDYEWVELFQVHDRKTGKLFGLTLDHDQFLRNEKDETQIEGLPVETLVFNPDPDYIYGIPDTRVIEPQLLELNEIRSQGMKHRRIDILKFLYRKGAIKANQLEKLLSEDVQAGIEIASDTSIKDAIVALNPGASGILADLERMGDVIRQDVRETVGFSRSSTGEYMGKTHITKAETDVVQWANQIRIDERRDMVADLLERVVRKFNQFIFTHWKSNIVRSIIGPDGARLWIKFSPAAIRAEYGLKVDPTNAVPVDPRTKRKDAIEMAGAYAKMNAGLIAQGQPIPAEIQRYFFSQFDGINVDKLLAQINNAPMAAPGAGNNPQQAVPPHVAAGMMRQRAGR